MKKIYLKLLLVFMTFSLNAQVYTEVEEITLKEGTENDYEAFESFWGTVKEKMISDGYQDGWFVWKVDPTSFDGNPWADYLIVNVYKNKSQMESLNNKPQSWWVDYMKMAHKGKTKKSVIKKYSNETVNNKYREKSVTYTNQRISDLSSGGNPSKGLVAYYHGIEQLNEDYVDFELKFFRELHKGRKLWWELNKISNRTDNAYKPVTHTIFEINDENAPSLESNFTNEMMLKYGQTTRKIHGTLKTTLVNWRWQ